MAQIWNDIASEFLHLYPTGPRLLAVAGTDAERSRSVADEVSTALAAAGQRTERVHTADGDEDVLRADVIAPFRADRSDRVLVVSGPSALLSASARGLWNFTIGQIADDEQPHTAASAIVDVTNPENPHRRFTDFCALPSAFGA